MKVTPLAIPEVLLIEPRVFADERGYFFESWNQQTFADHALDLQFVQDNESQSGAGTLRGIHLQIAHPQGKLVRVSSGRVFDVAVDLRPQSPTLGQWVSAELSDENKQMLWIPPGFGHAFLTLTPIATFNYKCTELYFPDDQYTLAWDDPDIAIDWPLERSALQLSEKDENGWSLKRIVRAIRKQAY